MQKLFCLFVVLTVFFTVMSGTGRAETASPLTLNETYRASRVSFETNVGQTNSNVKFLSRQAGYTLFLTSNEAVLALKKISNGRSGLLRMKWIGANTRAKPSGVEQLPGTSNYLLGNDPNRWLTHIPLYTKVRYKDVYPGVDLVYYGNDGSLEYDLLVSPSAHIQSIRLGLQGAGKIKLDREGNLILHVGPEVVTFRKPIIYQPQEAGNRDLVEGRYVLSARNEIRFQIGPHDPSRPLIIDPQLTYSSYLGGSATDEAHKVAVDSSGTAYVAGYSSSVDFPLAVPPANRTQGAYNVVVAKLNPAALGAASLIYATYIGGSGNSLGRGVAVDSQGQVYFAGDTTSPDFPVTPGAYQGACKLNAGVCSDVFVAKLDASGSRLLYSSYLGGTGTDFGFALAIDPVGQMYVAGNTDSSDLPATPGAFQTTYAGGPAKFGDAFVAKVNPAGGGSSDLLYLTYLGGSGSEQAWGIAVDTLGNLVLSGSTSSLNFPVTSTAFRMGYSGGTTDAFVAKLFPAGQGRNDLVYSTYLGGESDELAESIAVDASNFVYVTGETGSSSFPITALNAYQTNFGGGACPGPNCYDAFLVKLDTSLSGQASLVYSTFLGGNSFDLGHAIAVAAPDIVYVAGETASTGFPMVNPIQSTCTGGCPPAGFTSLTDIFLSKFDLTKPGTAGLLFSTYLGGSDVDTAWGLAVDTAGNAYLSGQVWSLDFPTFFPYQANCNNCIPFTNPARAGDSFLAKICTAGCTIANMPVGAGGATRGVTREGNELITGYAAATTISGNTPYAVAVYSLSQNDVIVSEVGVPASPPTTAARLYIDYGTQVSLPPNGNNPVDVYTGIAIVNREGNIANVTYTLRDLQGQVLAVGHGTLPAGAHRAMFLHELRQIAPDFLLPTNFPQSTRFGSLEVSSDRRLSVLALRMVVNQRGTALYTSVPVADLTQPIMSTKLFFPQIADGGGYTTSLILLNTSNAAQNGTLFFYDDSGSPLTVTKSNGGTGSSFAYSIPAGGTYVLQTDGASTQTRAGSMQLSPDAGSTTPAGAGIFSRTVGGALLTEAGVPSAIPTTRARVYVDTTDGHDSGIAVAATTASQVSVTLQAFATDGITPLGQPATVGLQGNGHIARYAGELISGLPANFTGVLDISAPTPVATLTLRQLINARRETLFTTLPVADLTRPAAAGLVFPQIADGGGYHTEYIFISAGDASRSALFFFGDDGSSLVVVK